MFGEQLHKREVTTVGPGERHEVTTSRPVACSLCSGLTVVDEREVTVAEPGEEHEVTTSRPVTRSLCSVDEREVMVVGPVEEHEMTSSRPVARSLCLVDEHEVTTVEPVEDHEATVLTAAPPRWPQVLSNARGVERIDGVGKKRAGLGRPGTGAGLVGKKGRDGDGMSLHSPQG
jgi:hypothetical protein